MCTQRFICALCILPLNNSISVGFAGKLCSVALIWQLHNSLPSYPRVALICVLMFAAIILGVMAAEHCQTARMLAVNDIDNWGLRRRKKKKKRKKRRRRRKSPAQVDVWLYYYHELEPFSRQYMLCFSASV